MSCCSFVAELRDDASSGLGTLPREAHMERSPAGGGTGRRLNSSEAALIPPEKAKRQTTALPQVGRKLQGQQEQRQQCSAVPQGRKGLQQLQAAGSSVPPLHLACDAVKRVSISKTTHCKSK